ncbi:uncharacterized protein LY89DRAFT_744173 [Mollisia scopiformis]|uniref:DUF7908 domain-containing protein n=1 Tax=Mollisia scopiformis TaxID=149040 RepID=A0A194XUA5_MOLSC|nr:uncharacterized protein LY89DRAFT_744173 [Mollisia scopiformis]KUJ23721.1 hypothetical protein LY89DRAFT_744173 [Mollisia scopiformis]
MTSPSSLGTSSTSLVQVSPVQKTSSVTSSITKLLIPFESTSAGNRKVPGAASTLVSEETEAASHGAILQVTTATSSQMIVPAIPGSSTEVIVVGDFTSVPTMKAPVLQEPSTGVIAHIASQEQSNAQAPSLEASPNGIVPTATSAHVVVPAVSTSGIILQIMPLGVHKRQSSNTYLVPKSPFGELICDSSITFTLESGQLSTSNGGHLSTTNGATWMAFQALSSILAINTEFTIDRNRYLVWLNDAFVGGQALFCEEQSGQIDILFQGSNDANDVSYPGYGTTCAPVSLMIVQDTHYLHFPSFAIEYSCLIL